MPSSRKKGTSKKKAVPDASVSPLARAGFLSRLTFHWMNELIMFGRHTRLDVEHIPALCEEDDCRWLSQEILRGWEHQLKLVKEGRQKQPSLWKPLLYAIRKPLLSSAVLCFIRSLTKIGEAVLLGYIIRFFQRPSAEHLEGYLWALGLSLAVLLHVIFHHLYSFPAMRMGFQARTGLIALLYRKALTLPASTATGSGQIVNLISNDVQCFDNASAMANYIWVGPVELIIVAVFLYKDLGWSAFIGVVAVLLLIPLHSAFARRFSYLRALTAKFRDDRIRSTGDLLSGIELIKLSAWEVPLEKRVNEQRDREMKMLFRAAWMKAFNVGLYFVLPGEHCWRGIL
ncbi:ABC transporter type 1, transmembrane domain-containing protein [Thamnocephalis sphaerospora]|uniref:ABC transporter type 1, transmembrane domain-containing protein n=1 Tax=Thamnocephalis sphaerospora TaxID=78915 RepID=A0A4P9XN46_9FUNG|nr:ABC transporter type 1, transmembrane domain-containing protein [Thamnocephalis sphaerospora]|eukprot:RKP07348.1 ABC transporter type 1, transmembrane domain-containing protein [Thamnocephalis sphaerospora]